MLIVARKFGRPIQKFHVLNLVMFFVIGPVQQALIIKNTRQGKITPTTKKELLATGEKHLLIIKMNVKFVVEKKMLGY